MDTITVCFALFPFANIGITFIAAPHSASLFILVGIMLNIINFYMFQAINPLTVIDFAVWPDISAHAFRLYLFKN
jgi:hypothetical protein